MESSGPSGSETETEEEDDVQCESSDEDIVETIGVDTNLAEELHEYEGLEMQYQKKTSKNRSRKIRPANFDRVQKKPKPPSGKKTSKQKVYNKPKRVEALLKIYSKTRMETI